MWIDEILAQSECLSLEEGFCPALFATDLDQTLFKSHLLFCETRRLLFASLQHSTFSHLQHGH
jgi:hypothetical protein